MPGGVTVSSVRCNDRLGRGVLGGWFSLFMDIGVKPFTSSRCRWDGTGQDGSVQLCVPSRTARQTHTERILWAKTTFYNGYGLGGSNQCAIRLAGSFRIVALLQLSVSAKVSG
jgi:hypothetical protein